MIKEYYSDFYDEPIIVENIDWDISVSILDSLWREAIYSWYDIKNKNTHSDYINKSILWWMLQESINSVLVLWAGAGAHIKYLEDHFDYINITAIDIDETMIDIAKNELWINTDDIHIWDIQHVVKKLMKQWEKYDLILFDIYGSNGEIPKHLVNRELFFDIQKLLYETWVFSINYSNFYIKSYDIVDIERKKKYIELHKILKDIFWEYFTSFLSEDSEWWNVSVSYNLDKNYTLEEIKKEYFYKVKIEDISKEDKIIENIKLDEKKLFLK